MTEQQRREQIMKMRQQAATPAAPSLSDAEAMRIASNGNGLTQEQMIAIAMFGKVVQNDVNGIKKAGLGDLKVSDVDMSKVMPSGIAKAAGMPMPQAIRSVAPILPPVPAQSVIMPVSVVESVQTDPSSQLEFDFDKKARYIEVVEAINSLEKKLDAINIKLEQLLEDNKKKLNLTLNENGTQTG